MKTIGITGGTGFIGQHVTDLLVNKGYKVVVFTTRVSPKPALPNVTYAHWNPDKGELDINALKEVNAVVHLAGAGIADKRWTEERKKEIIDSRVKGTTFLISQLREYAPACKTFIAASAIGFYGSDREGAIPFTEANPPADDFIADTCTQWEMASQQATGFLRTVILRLGIVLGKGSGAFPQFANPLSFGMMPVLGSGKQIISWIEVGDLSRLMFFVLENEVMTGVYNAVSPFPVTYKDLINTIAMVKGGIKISVPVPAFVLRILLGEMSGEILKSCTVSAQKVLGAGFTFNYAYITIAVRNILSTNG